MANIINQLEISGITYDIQDNDAQNTLLTKQDALVSGVNIKTINNESLLGSGNIVIEGGTGDAYTKAETDALLSAKADTSTVTSAVTEFSAALGNEITRAQGVEQVLSGAIDTKVDSNDVYLKSSTSSSTEINNALQTKADASTTYTKAETDNAINAATSGKADTSAVTSAVSEFTTALSGEIQRAMAAEQTISGAVDTKANSSDVYLKSETSSSTEINNALQAKADASTTYSKSEVDTAINAATSGKADTSAVTADINAAVSGKADTSAVTSAVTEFTAALSGEIQRAQGVEQVLSGAIDGKQATLVSGTNIKTINNQSLLGSGNITIQGGGGANVVELTQAEYDALATKDPDTFYIITDATPIDTRMFYTTAQTSSSTEIATALAAKADAATTSSATQISDALAAKQNTLTAGTGIDITNDVISVTGGGGGGKAVSAGTNISITTGDTADTINCTLPIVMKGSNMRINSTREFANSLSNCFTFGGFNTVGNGNSCGYLFTFGSDNDMSAANNNRRYRYAFGTFLKTQNSGEIAFSKYNVSSSASETFGDSGNTLFSVGNGTYNARHNAFEIRQNGDIYITSGGTDIKLQDNLGGGSVTVDSALDSTSENPVQNKVIYAAIGDIETLLAAL